MHWHLRMGAIDNSSQTFIGSFLRIFGSGLRIQLDMGISTGGTSSLLWLDKQLSGGDLIVTLGKCIQGVFRVSLQAGILAPSLSLD